MDLTKGVKLACGATLRKSTLAESGGFQAPGYAYFTITEGSGFVRPFHRGDESRVRGGFWYSNAHLIINKAVLPQLLTALNLLMEEVLGEGQVYEKGE